jgi:hypothetical protein
MSILPNFTIYSEEPWSKTSFPISGVCDMDLSPSPVHYQQRRCPRPLAQRIFGVAPRTPKAYLGHRHSCPDVKVGAYGGLG